eukprot:TRINITY_DN1592_c0_g1_i1.p1 TRINITY_DN1592_c0_g1~~TRINITY_DN1592_c0_g1_i1.p1  ORF type:complete len:469 (+),score=111.50 TRINITY_DN1592_c0_g1_i1:325-1731(+)
MIREHLHILVDGEDVPPICTRFVDLKLPPSIISGLAKKGITKPSPIQAQGLPVILSGRDMIGVAHTGSGKTLVFSLPAVMFALEEEMKLPIVAGEGPFSLILCPSRELALQTTQVIQGMCDSLSAAGFPSLRCALLMGGGQTREQENKLRSGVHIIVATPGRLLHFLNSKRFTLTLCKYFVMDEADRLIDLGFEEDIRNIMDHFKGQRQTVLFSATMPKTIQNFARSALVKPIEVNVGRAGAASLDVLQEVEFVAQEAKIVYLLEVLQKTPPPVLIFAENKTDVDDIHEFLLLKGVNAVSTHGGKDQEERTYAVSSFRDGKKDVLIATDVASKGLDFNDVQHVINFDMPKEIENYVHRIGRTGRGGRTGVATTFVNKNTPVLLLLDLKQLLIEAKQKVPPFLANLEAEQAADGAVVEQTGVSGCSYCGGLGHRIANCPKLEQTKLKQIRATTSSGREFAGGGGGGGGY